MDFAYSPKVRELAARVAQFMDDNVYPAEAHYAAEVEANRKRGNAWVATTVMEALKAKARAADLWNLFLPESELGAGLTNLEYAPLCEIMGRFVDRARDLQLQRPRHRQHGGARSLRHRRAEEAVARAAASRRDPLGLRDDRARCRVVGRDEYRRRRSCATATTTSSTAGSGGPSGGGRSAVRDPDLHGQDRSANRGPASTAVDDPGADRHARREARPCAPGVRLRRRAARPRRV